jgi:ectoine hydroxylase-related dioxygenase (phytanoyl-CoA dioxygenase family)
VVQSAAFKEDTMKSDNIIKQRMNRVWLSPEHCDLDDFKRSIDRVTKADDYPFAADIVHNVPVYDGAAVTKASADPEGRMAVMAEWAEAMMAGPGIVVFKNTGMDMAAMDRASKVFFDIISEQHAAGAAGGDHFAKAGANDRIWNALEKLALRDPDCFAAYYANDMIAMVSEAWLGTGYQITSQLNVVNPGGASQSAHRDYHMGFQTSEQIGHFPAHAHLLSPVLTLQGAVAHVDMPVETGPTLYLPYSQAYAPGYFAYHKSEFQAYFDAHRTQLPLAKGDMAFFNPALFHAAGHNRTTETKRMANLLQVSSAYGRAMESVDRLKMCEALYPVLQAAQMTPRAISNVIAASAEGYAFPTNLDRDPPVGGLAPETQAGLMHRALKEKMSFEALKSALAQRHWARQT